VGSENSVHPDFTCFFVIFLKCSPDENLARNDDIGSLEPVSLWRCAAQNGDFGSRPTKPDHRVKTLREKGEDQGTGSIPLDVSF